MFLKFRVVQGPIPLGNSDEPIDPKAAFGATNSAWGSARAGDASFLEGWGAGSDKQVSSDFIQSIIHNDYDFA